MACHRIVRLGAICGPALNIQNIHNQSIIRPPSSNMPTSLLSGTPHLRLQHSPGQQLLHRSVSGGNPPSETSSEMARRAYGNRVLGHMVFITA